MAQDLKAGVSPENEPLFYFLSEKHLEDLEAADANPYVKMCEPDKNIPFIVLADGGVVADITANNPKTILKNMEISDKSGKLLGAGSIDVFHGNKTLLFHHIESAIFEKKWLVDNIASALQHELNLYYPEYRIRSH